MQGGLFPEFCVCMYVMVGGGGTGGGISQYIRGESWGSSDSVFSNVVS